MMAQKNILFITPVLPSLKGRGRNFRAYQWVWRLQKEFEVTVICTSIYGEFEYNDRKNLSILNCNIFKLDHKYSTVRRFKNLFSFQPSTWNAVGNFIERELSQQIPKPDVILCFRIQNAPTALYLSRFWGTSEIWLDIDEVDSKVKSSIAELMWSEGYYLKGIKQWMEAQLYSFQESRLLTEFNCIFSSTTEEEKNLKDLNFISETEVFSNMVPMVTKNHWTEPKGTPFTFMFVGDSNYFPNLDAINFLIFSIIPRLEKITEIPFRFIIIGGDVGDRQLKQIEKYDCITFYQDIDDLKFVYDQANAVIVPLRAGGGSSLKFLEALRYKKPVIATSVGARGFDVRHGTQVLLGEDVATITEHCQTLMNRPELTRSLSENGHQWFVKNYSIDMEMAENLEVV